MSSMSYPHQCPWPVYLATAQPSLSHRKVTHMLRVIMLMAMDTVRTGEANLQPSFCSTHHGN